MRTIGIISANYVSGDFGDLLKGRTLASLPYGGRYRLIDFALSNMTNSGINTVCLIAPYNAASLIDHIGVGKPWSLDRKTGGLFLVPGSLYGVTMSGDRFLMRDLVANKKFLQKDDADYVVVSGSSDVVNMDYNPIIKKHVASGNQITVVTKQVEDPEKYRGFFVKSDDNGKVVDLSRKPDSDANFFMDVFVISRQLLMDLIDWFGSLDHLDIMDVLAQNLGQFDIGTYEFYGYLGKVSNLADYYQVNQDLLDPRVMNELFGTNRVIYTKVQDEAPAQFKSGSKIKNSLVAAGCTIEGTVENSIVFRSTHVAKGAVVKNSIVMQHGTIEADVLIDKAILDKNVTVNEGVHVIGGNKPIVIGKDKEI